MLAIRAGTYHGFTTNKALALIGTPGATKVVTAQVGLPVLEVLDIPVGRTFAARDLVILAFGMTPRLVFRRCSGPVVLQRLESENTYFGVSLEFDSCGAAELTACGLEQSAFQAGVAVRASASDVFIQSCLLRGQYAVLDPRGLNLYATAGVRAQSGSRVFLAETTVIGGAGAHEWPYVGTYRTSAAGVSLLASSARVGRGCDVAAGLGATPALPVSGIDGTGTVELDPSVPVTPYGGAPPIAPTVTVDARVVSALGVTGGDLGGLLQIDLRSAASRPYVLAVGQLAASVPTPFGSLFLAPSSLIVLTGGLQTSQGALTWSLPVPPNPALYAQHLAWQAATEDPLGRVDLTNPAAVVLR